MTARLLQRLRSLEARLPPYVREPLPDVVPRWQKLARSSPEALAHAQAYTRRVRELWPDREPTSEEFPDDDECVGHWLWLEATAAGGLANLLAPALDDACG